jgi:RHS repeat-associated protein
MPLERKHTHSKANANFNYWLNDAINQDEYEEMIFFYHKDHLGSSTQISDIDANIIQHIEYLPYGETFFERRSYWNTPYKFNAKELDEETGLYYYGARYYTPEVSIWLSVDPLADKYPSMSAFMYCAGNPMRYIDPDGRSFGDYFDRLGNYLGNDGKEDGKVYLLNEGLRAKTENKNVNWGGKLSDKHAKALKSKSTEIDMNSDLGYMIRTVYAEMRSGDDNAKIIVAESVKNRLDRKLGSYENPDGTYKGVINVKGAYSITNPKDKAHDSFANPTNHIYNNDAETNAWRSSISAALKVHFGISGDIGKGVTSYHSLSSTYFDNNKAYEKIRLSISHKGIKGLWKLK